MTDRTLEELERTYLSDSSVIEYDRCVARHRRRRLVRYAAGCAGVLLVAVSLSLWSGGPWSVAGGEGVDAGTAAGSGAGSAGADIPTVEILEAINVLANTGMDEIASITATPSEIGLVVTAEYRDGRTARFLMKKDADGSAVELTAMK